MFSKRELLGNIRFLLLFTLPGVIATVEIFWEWNYMVHLILAVFWGLAFTPRDGCRYVCVLEVYAQIHTRLRVSEIKVDEGDVS